MAAPEYGYGPDQVTIQLELKQDMRRRGLSSPDAADALACTFAEYVAPREVPGYLDPMNYGRAKPYDRHAELEEPYGRDWDDYDRYGEL
jgi:hypothetical protein